MVNICLLNQVNKPSFVSNITSSKEWFKNGSMHVWSLVDCKRYWQFATLSEREALLRVGPIMRKIHSIAI